MNTSGIHPKGNRVLIKPDKLENKTEGGIIIPETERDRHQMGILTGVIVDMGADSFREENTEVFRLMDGEMKLVERRVSGYEAFAKEGDRICFARYAGQPMPGEDGEEYRLLNDLDITAVISDKIDMTEFRKRESL